MRAQTLVSERKNSPIGVKLTAKEMSRFERYLRRLGHGSKKGPFLRDLLIKTMNDSETGEARDLSDAMAKARKGGAAA